MDLGGFLGGFQLEGCSSFKGQRRLGCVLFWLHMVCLFTSCLATPSQPMALKYFDDCSYSSHQPCNMMIPSAFVITMIVIAVFLVGLLSVCPSLVFPFCIAKIFYCQYDNHY